MTWNSSLQLEPKSKAGQKHLVESLHECFTQLVMNHGLKNQYASSIESGVIMVSNNI